MKRLLDLIGMYVGGWLGWTVGAGVSFFTGFVVSVLGTAGGVYLARRISRELLP